MPNNFKGRIKSGYENIEYTKTGGSVDYASPIDRSSPAYVADLTAGTGINQADTFYRAEVTIAGSGTFVLDLNGSANTDIFGTNLTMLTLVDLMVINAPIDPSAAANANTVTLTTTIAGLLSGGTPNVPLKPGTQYHLSNTGATGLATVTPSTADTITLTNASGASVKVQIAAIGRSA